MSRPGAAHAAPARRPAGRPTGCLRPARPRPATGSARGQLLVLILILPVAGLALVGRCSSVIPSQGAAGWSPAGFTLGDWRPQPPPPSDWPWPAAGQRWQAQAQAGQNASSPDAGAPSELEMHAAINDARGRRRAAARTPRAASKKTEASPSGADIAINNKAENNSDLSQANDGSQQSDGDHSSDKRPGGHQSMVSSRVPPTMSERKTIDNTKATVASSSGPVGSTQQPSRPERGQASQPGARSDSANSSSPARAAPGSQPSAGAGPRQTEHTQTPFPPPPAPAPTMNNSTDVQPAKALQYRQKTIRQVPVSNAPGVGELSAPSQQAAAAAAAYALAQEDRKAANKLNAELCKNFSIGIQHETGGVFTSPNYPNPYPANLICTKLIEAPSGYYVVLEFRDQFNIEEAGIDCDNDKIEIRDGRFGYSKVLARYCGNRFPPEVRSTDEAMWLRFISDGSITHTGFKAVYRFERQKNTKPLPPFECRFNVTTMPTLPGVNATDNRTGIHSGIIKNTDVPERLIDYSKQYNVSLECIWNITVTPGWKIYLTFSSYEINKPNDCDSNFIEIYEENLTEENQTVKFCGTRTEPQQSRSNVFNIRHHAIPSASSSKFEIIYTAFREKGLAGCDTREFDCDDGTCIHESLKCDGTINCKYRYDEASEPGPCAIGEDVQPFFETEHMVIILIVFLTLVSGMCASIIVSCWGKIQERRRRKLEYHMRKSREASMEGQMNKVDQLYSSNDGSNGNGSARQGVSSNLKQRLTAPIVPSENHLSQQHSYGPEYPRDSGPFPSINEQHLIGGGIDIEQHRQLLTSGSHLSQHPLMIQQPSRSNTIAAEHYGRAYDGHPSSIVLQKQHHLIGASNPNLNAMRMLQQHQYQHSSGEQQERSRSVYGSRSKKGIQAGIYGIQQGQPSTLAGNTLSSSTACCNASTETPLISDLVKRANLHQQHQQQQAHNRLVQMAQTNNAIRMQQQMSDAVPVTSAIPRSLSAYQLSRSQLRLNQQQQQQQQLQRQHQQLLLQQRQHQVQSAYVKSVSDAGQVNKHQPPNHSLSYPHACSGIHAGEPGSSLIDNESPALPPPPPPPNLITHQVGRSQTSCATLPPQMSDNKRQAFKISRLDPSQLTGDTLPDSDLVMTHMPLGSIQFDDVSTESDATFGMLIDSVGNASLNFNPQMSRQASTMAPNHQPQHPLLLSQSYKTVQPVSHLSECNLVRRQRADTLASEGGSIGRQQMLMSQTSCICDCGAFERANQMRQHPEHNLINQRYVPSIPMQRQLIQTDTRDFDMDSDEVKAIQGAPYGFTDDMNDSNNIVVASQVRPGRQVVHMNQSNILSYNGSSIHQPTAHQQQMRLDRFRQQSSELTADDDEDPEDDNEMDRNCTDNFNNLGNQIDVDDEDDISSDVPISQRRRNEGQKSISKFGTIASTPKSIIRRNEEELKDVETIGLRQKHLSGSHTSICTCGSQAKIDIDDIVDDNDEEDNSYGNVAQSLTGQKLAVQTSVKNQAANKEINSQPSNQSGDVNEVLTKQAGN